MLGCVGAVQGVGEKLSACLAEAGRCPASFLIQQLQVPHLITYETTWCSLQMV